MKDLTAIRARYMRDPLPIRLGGLAADLGRVSSFSKNPDNYKAVQGLLREAAHFIEWSAPEAELDVQLSLLELQRRLVDWWFRLPQQFGEEVWRTRVAEEAEHWSQRVLEVSGLLK